MNGADSSDGIRDANAIVRLPTGVRDLDAVLGGGIPELSFNLIAGGPGAGKTTLAMQIVFANATATRPGLYFTVLGEPTLKMLRYQQRFSFFDIARVGSEVHLLNLSGEAASGDLDTVLARIRSEVERYNPAIVVVDSFRTLGSQAPHGTGADPLAHSELEQFVQQLALQLTTWETTSFLISEYAEDEQRHPVFTVADGIIWVSQVTDRNSIVRKLQVVKIRGQEFMPGLHTYRITREGLRVYPRIPEHRLHRSPGAAGGAAERRLATGVPGLDEMLGGGLQAGNAVMLAGATGTGKTTFATQFIAQGHADRQPTVVAVFEEYPEGFIRRAMAIGIDLAAMVDEGMLRIIYLRPLDLSVDETLAAILEAVTALQASRVVIDSLSGFEIALAPAFREDFRESFYRLVGALTAIGVTVFMTTEVSGALADASFTGEHVSFLTDDIILQRRVEIDGRLRTVLAVVKMRGSAHSDQVREYTIGARGAVVGEQVRGFRGFLTGTPEPGENRAGAGGLPYVGLTGQEVTVLDALIRLREATVDELVARSGAAADVVERALERLVTLEYAVTFDDAGSGPAYRAAVRVDRT